MKSAVPISSLFSLLTSHFSLPNSAPTVCKHTVSGSFHSPPGVLFTFPSQYYTLSVTKEYLGLEDGPPMFPPGFTCPAVLWIRLADSHFRVRGSHSLWRAVPCPSANVCQYRAPSEPRGYYYPRFGLFRVRSPLLAESRLISFPRPT